MKVLLVNVSPSWFGSPVASENYASIVREHEADVVCLQDAYDMSTVDEIGEYLYDYTMYTQGTNLSIYVFLLILLFFYLLHPVMASMALFVMTSDFVLSFSPVSRIVGHRGGLVMFVRNDNKVLRMESDKWLHSRMCVCLRNGYVIFNTKDLENGFYHACKFASVVCASHHENFIWEYPKFTHVESGITWRNPDDAQDCGAYDSIYISDGVPKPTTQVIPTGGPRSALLAEFKT